MKYERILLQTDGPVAYVTLNRPEVRNAMDERTITELADCFGKELVKAARSKGRERAPRAVVLRGAGKLFCAGADIRWMRRAAEYPPARNRKDAYRLAEMYRSIDECPLPVIGRVHGAVYGGGLGLVAACDVVVAEAATRMIFSEARMGILPSVITNLVLPKIGISHTRRLYMTGELFDMELARRIGLVHEAVPAAELDEKVRFFVDNILKGGPEVLSLSKAYIRKMIPLGPKARLKLSVDTLMKARSAPEGKEGFSAFLEKRAPKWAPKDE